MSKALFLSYPGYGHINFTLGLVKELIEQGEKVVYYSTEKFRKIIEATGAEFFPYDDKFFESEFVPTKVQNFLYNMETFFFQTKILLASQQAIVDEMYEQIAGQRADYIIHDSCAISGKIIARRAGIPAVACFSNLPMNEKLRQLYPEYLARNYLNFAETYLYTNIPQGVRRTQAIINYKLKMETNIEFKEFFELFHSSENLNIVFTSKLFQPYSETFDNTYEFVGPVLYEFYNDDDFKLDTKGKPLIYISFGTTLLNNFSLFKVIFDALKDMDVQVILSLGGQIDISGCGSVPANFTILDFVPQKEVLRNASLFITCGSTNGANEALYFNVPMITIPFALADHFMVAEQVEKLGIGFYVKDISISSRALAEMVNEILSSSSYKNNCRAVGESLRIAGGAKKGAERIMSYITNSYKKY